MKMINLYIQEVTRRLPEKSREDIGLELESTIYDMLPEDYDEEDVKEALQSLGNPAILASKYSEKPMHLIGPKYFDVYTSFLKLILPISIILSLITVVAVKVLNPVEGGAVLETILEIIGEGIWHMLTVAIHTFFWITVTFAIVERADKENNRSPISMNFKPWTPDDLKMVTYLPKEKRIKNYEFHFGLIWTVIWAAIYFYADRLIGVYENGDNGLRLVSPAFDQDILLSFWPWVVLLIIGEVVLTVYKYMKKQWTYRLASLQALYELATTVVFVVIITRSNLFTTEFLQKTGELFDTTSSKIEASMTWGLVTISIVYTVIAIYDVYKKANIKVKDR
ncbi:HAAS signaling domain-containing protein [Gracilibacillus dipsosauri]|uniref:HAAS signaling domain-containing protein n=1 Tax=Gracilibacillus dipsosauri TaxID=178340 RepID=UPI002409A437